MNAPENIPGMEIVLRDLTEGKRVPDPGKMCKFTLTVPETDVQKLHAFMNSDSYERAEAAREASIESYTSSLQIAMNWAMHHDCSGAAVFARLLASLYNGERVKMCAARPAESPTPSSKMATRFLRR